MPSISERELCDLIGEIACITLDSEPCKGKHGKGLEDVVVRVELVGREKPIEIIRALRSGEGVIGHAITRLGIRMALARGKKS